MIPLATLAAGFMFYFLVVTRNTSVQRLFIGPFFFTGLIFILRPDPDDSFGQPRGNRARRGFCFLSLDPVSLFRVL